MAKRNSPITNDPCLQAIDDLEAAMIQAHDEKIHYGVSPEEVARFRPAVVALAKAVADARRAEHYARRRES